MTEENSASNENKAENKASVLIQPRLRAPSTRLRHFINIKSDVKWKIVDILLKLKNSGLELTLTHRPVPSATMLVTFIVPPSIATIALLGVAPPPWMHTASLR
jgi:hypothetical protein